MALKPRLLDLFCGAGGAAMGYARAGFDVVGVDINPQPHYPFKFHQADALQSMDHLLSGGTYLFGHDGAVGLSNVAAIHASPPCQSFSDLAKRNGNAHEWPNLIPQTRELLQATGLPYVIENVEGAPLVEPIRLCGTMFAGLRVIRHRLFESNVPMFPPPHDRHPLVFTHDKRKAHYGQLDQRTAFVQVTGGGNATIANKRAAMGMPWASNRGLNEAIPPAYAEWVGRRIVEVISCLS